MPSLPDSNRIVTNTSPLQYLWIAGKLLVLEQLYGRIIVPQAVVNELEEGKWLGYNVPDCRSYAWMTIETVDVPSSVKRIRHLGSGEAEAIALALFQPTDLVLLDDALGREVAAREGVRYSGTLGVLLQAKQQGLIAEVPPSLSLIKQAGFRISDPLLARIRRIAGELDNKL